MSVVCINGLPGKGKTLLGTSIAVKHFNKENTFFKKVFRKIKKEDIIVNNVYSNYPILLNKRKNIYSNIVSINDLKNQFSFKPNSIIIIDEIQLFYDSDEYKTFPRIIANFNQAHRHFLIKDIYYISQHPSRVIKKLRNVCSEYYRIKNKVVIPLLKIGFISCRITYEFEDYELSFTKDKDLMKMRDIKRKLFFINFRKIFKSYDTIYLLPLNENKPLINHGTFNGLCLSGNEKNELEKILF